MKKGDSGIVLTILAFILISCANVPETKKIKQEFIEMGKLNGVQFIKIRNFKAVSSGSQQIRKLFIEGGFDNWISSNDHIVRDCFYAHPDFMWHEQDGYATWIWAVKDNVTSVDCEPYELIEFKGGMYAVGTAIVNNGGDGEAFLPISLPETSEIIGIMVKLIEESGIFEMDSSPRYAMGRMVGNGTTNSLDLAQQEIFLPIKYKSK